jgi:low affinity Fe/Cu permease
VQSEIPSDVITWRIVVSVLAVFCVTLSGLLYHSFVEKFARMENKIDGIIRYLISHSPDGKQEDLAKLVGR